MATRYSILKYYKDDCTIKLPNWQKADLKGHGNYIVTSKIPAQPNKYRVPNGASYQNRIKVCSRREEASKIVYFVSPERSIPSNVYFLYLRCGESRQITFLPCSVWKHKNKLVFKVAPKRKKDPNKIYFGFCLGAR